MDSAACIPRSTRSPRAPPPPPLRTAQASCLAASTPTLGRAHVLAEREAEKAGIFHFDSGGKRKMILLFSLLWETVQAQEESSDDGQPKGNDKYPV